MPVRTFGPSKGNRRPSTAIPGSSGAGRPAPQKGGGGNKEAGSVEPTAANTPTVTVHRDGTVTAEHFGPGPKAVAAAERQKVRAQASKRRTRRIRSEVLKSTRSQPVRAKGPELKPARPVTKPVSAQGFTTKVNSPKEGGQPTAAQARSKAPAPPKAKSLPASTAIISSNRPAKAPPQPQTPAQKHPRAVKKVRHQLKALRSKVRTTGGPIRTAEVTTPEQVKNAKTVLRTGQRMGASRKEKLAAIETGLVESYGFKNLKGGDADSAGWRQERRQYYPNPTNVKAGAKNFFDEAKEDPAIPGGGGETPGQLAQTVQASDYPERYDERAAEAKSLLHQFNQGKPDPKVTAKLKAVEAKAERLGVPTHEKAPSKVVKKYHSALSAMTQINKKGYEYQWGGGHAKAGEPVGGPGVGFDCSGAISAMLHSVGALDTPLTSGLMGQALDPGPGAITVFYNSVHTFAYIPAKHEYWGTSESNPGGGAGYFPKSVGDSEVASGDSGGMFNVGHVPGLGKKQARQLGVLHLGPGTGSTSSSGSFSAPGMTISSDGTTATVDPGSGAHQEKPGFSKHPLTLSQQVARTTRKLKALGVIKDEPKSTGRPTMSSLEKKYGAPVV